MTEDEMKQTWCPDARVATTSADDPAVFNRIVDDLMHFAAMCVGSKCSAWRWTAEVPEVEVHAGDKTRPFVVASRAVARQHGYTVIRELPMHGYCGRAGRPS